MRAIMSRFLTSASIIFLVVSNIPSIEIILDGFKRVYVEYLADVKKKSDAMRNEHSAEGQV